MPNVSERLHEWILQKQEEYFKGKKPQDIMPPFTMGAIQDALEEAGVPQSQHTLFALSAGYWVGFLYGKYPDEMERVAQIGEP